MPRARGAYDPAALTDWLLPFFAAPGAAWRPDLAFGFLLDRALGDPWGWPHPVRWIGAWAALLERVLRRVVPWERGAGVLLWILVVVPSAAIPAATAAAAFRSDPAAGWATAAVWTWLALAGKDLERHARAVLVPLGASDLPAARSALARIVGRDTGALDEAGCSRACVESVAEGFSDGFLAPLLFALAGGPGAAWAYKAANTLDSMVGHRDERYRRFGWFSARVDDLLNLLPARLAALAWAAAAPAGGASVLGGIRGALRQGLDHESPNAGYPEAAAAWSLGIRLGGPSTYGREPHALPVLNPGGRSPTAADAARAVRTLRAAAWIAAALALAAWAALARLA